jgi:hypothetical protein
MERPLFNWRDLEISPAEAEKAKLLVEDSQIIATFLKALDLLKLQRRNRSISIEEFTRGLMEVATAIERFLEHDEAFTDTEVKLQTHMLEGFIDLLCESLELFGEGCPFGNRFEDLKDKFKKGALSRRDYWRSLIGLTTEVLNFFHDSDIPPKHLRYVLSIILSFVDYFQCVLIHKRELVEDFFGENA